MSRLNSIAAGSGSAAAACDADCATCVRVAPNSSANAPIHAETRAVRIVTPFRCAYPTPRRSAAPVRSRVELSKASGLRPQASGLGKGSGGWPKVERSAYSTRVASCKNLNVGAMFDPIPYDFQAARRVLSIEV